MAAARHRAEMSTIVRPPPAATLAPLRERVWNAASQTRILKDELLGLTLYRRITSCDADAALMARLEDEFAALVSRAGELEPEGVYCVRFPAGLPGRTRFLIARCAERFHLQPHSFGEDEDRFMVVYMHPRGAMAPVLRCADFMLARSYYAPPPPPPYEHKRSRYEKAENKTIEEYQLDATELFLNNPDFAPWTAAAGYGGGSTGADGYECEVAACHEHLIELTDFSSLAGGDRPALLPEAVGVCSSAEDGQTIPSLAMAATDARPALSLEVAAACSLAQDGPIKPVPPLAMATACNLADAKPALSLDIVAACNSGEDGPIFPLAMAATDAQSAPSLEIAAACIPTAVALRPLPAGFIAVFPTATDARAFLTDRAPPPGTPPAGARLAPGAEALLLDMGGAGVWACSGRPLSALHQRRALQLGPRGRGGGAPRALQAALRGLGGPRGGHSRGSGARRGTSS
jgi:hypothetical protein